MGELKKEIIGKCEELLPRDVRDNKVMGQFGANHILSGKYIIKLYLYLELFVLFTYIFLLFLPRIMRLIKGIQDKNTHQLELIL